MQIWLELYYLSSSLWLAMALMSIEKHWEELSPRLQKENLMSSSIKAKINYSQQGQPKEATQIVVLI
jgi:hypothetical protein